jgi:large subunit ribosomal protein L23
MGLFNKTKKEKEIKKKKTVKKEPVVLSAKAEEKKDTVVKKSAKKEFSQAYRIFKKPLITEKTTDLSGRLSQYVFVVAPNANKNEIKKAVQDLYGVDVLRVNTIKVPGKKRRLGQHEGFKPGYKKAIVFLAAGQQIEVISR